MISQVSTMRKLTIAANSRPFLTALTLIKRIMNIIKRTKFSGVQQSEKVGIHILL